MLIFGLAIRREIIMSDKERTPDQAQGESCIQCARELPKGNELVCPSCFAAMPRSFHNEWKQARKTKAKEIVLGKVHNFVRMKQAKA